MRITALRIFSLVFGFFAGRKLGGLAATRGYRWFSRVVRVVALVLLVGYLLPKALA